MGKLLEQTGEGRKNQWAQAQPPLFFIPGWGFDGRIAKLIGPQVDWVSLPGFVNPNTLHASLIDACLQLQVERLSIIGWSMGGYLALDFAQKHPDKVASLTLVSLRQQWPMEEILLIKRELENDCEKLLRSFYRRCFLGHREEYGRFTKTLQADYLKNLDRKTLLDGLDYLSRAECHAPPTIRIHLIHGRDDIIAPIDQIPDIPGSSLEVVEHSGHIPFFSSHCSLQTMAKKMAIRDKFSQAASTYDTYAVVQKKLSKRLLGGFTDQRLSGPGQKILEIGCGTGNYTRSLAEAFPNSFIEAMDFSRDMLKLAEEKLAGHYKTIDFICADGEEYLNRLSRDHGGVYDCITSNATLQWFTDLERALIHIAGLLKPQGLLLCSIFGSQTLWELKMALSSVLDNEIFLAASNFLTSDELNPMLAGLFSSIVVEETLLKIQYDSVEDLLSSLKKTGAIGWRQGPSPLFTRSHLLRLNQWFKDKSGSCEVTYQAFLVKARK